MNNIISHEEMVKQSERILKSFYMVGFKAQDTDAGLERFSEQMGYPRNTPMGDLSHYAKQAIIAIAFLIDEAKSDSENEWWRVPELRYQIKYLEETFVEPIEERKVDTAGADAIARPEWLTPNIQAEVAKLWKTENVNNSNPRVRAIELIRGCANDAGYNMGIDFASKIIKQHCL